MNHTALLYLSFGLGTLLWWLNKADDRARGSDPNVTKWWQYFTAYWIPLLTRALAGLALFSLVFKVEVLSKLLALTGLESWAETASLVTQFAPMAGAFGFSVDPVLEKVLAKLAPVLPFNLPVIPEPHKVEPQPPVETKQP